MTVSVIPTLDLERAIAEQGYDVIVGFDEVGRGSLAGPVMVGAAAIWARDLDGPAGASQGGSQESSHLEVPKGVADSKMLTEHKREAIFDELKSWCASWAVGAASNKEIDEWGISHALGVAALRALAQAEAKLGIDGNGMLSGKPVKVGAILDGPNDYITKTLNTFDAPEVPVPANVTTKVKGDRYCAAVAAAAVIAKVTRDRSWSNWERNPNMNHMNGPTTRVTVRPHTVTPSLNSGPATCTACPGTSSDIRHLIRSPRLR